MMDIYNKFEVLRCVVATPTSQKTTEPFKLYARLKNKAVLQNTDQAKVISGK